MSNALPLIIEPEQLEQELTRPQLRIIDVSKQDLFSQGHIPGAVFLDYMRLIHNEKPVFGLVPESARLEQLFADLGITPETHVVAYDEEGGGKASRLLWTLDIVGHRNWSLLNGGIASWTAEGRPLSRDNNAYAPGKLPVRFGWGGVAEKEYIMSHLLDPNYVLLDCRSQKEYIGAEKRAELAGHIPGAVNLDWMDIKDPDRQQRLRSDTELRALLAGRGINPGKEIIVYCHSHHRSALAYVALKYLGYKELRGYPGSWSDWGNDPTAPVET